MKDFRRLKVWEKAHLLILDVYKMTACFPREELYGLTSQLRRSAASMGANIAEGCGKEGNRELYRFLKIASGSASELDYNLLLAKDLNYLAEGNYEKIGKQLLEVRKMLTALLQKVGSDRFVANC